MIKINGRFIFTNLILEEKSTLLMVGGGENINKTTYNTSMQVKSISFNNSQIYSSDVLQVNFPSIIIQIGNILSQENILLDTSQLINVTSS